MLKKCFKYDFRSVFKIWWIAAVTVIALSVLAGFGGRNLFLHVQDPDRVFILETTALVLFYFSIFALGILTSVLLGIRFYSNFFSDEGYLTFTLPVKRATLFWSKVLNGFLFEIMSAAVVVFSLIIITLIIPSSVKEHITLLGEIVGGFIESLKEIPKNEIVWLVIYIIEAFLFVLMFMLSGVLLLYMLITLGSTAAKRFKAAATVGFLVGANYVLSALLVPAIFAFVLWLNAALHLYEETISDFAGFSFFALIFLFFSIVLGTANALFMNITQGCLERKLNLS